jgi:hypothetical protein
VIHDVIGVEEAIQRLDEVMKINCNTPRRHPSRNATGISTGRALKAKGPTDALASQGIDLGKLADVHEIYKEVIHDVIGVEEAIQRLDPQ